MESAMSRNTIVRFKAKVDKPPVVVVESIDDLDRELFAGNGRPVTAHTPEGAPVRIHPELVSGFDVEVG
jgi:hypothetical protein